MLIYKNAKIVTKDKTIEGYLEVDDHGNIKCIKPGSTNEPGIDCCGHYLMPSFIDTHTHGGYGMSFDDFANTPSFQEEYANYLNGIITEGVGAYVPTNVSLSLEKLNEITTQVKQYLSQPQVKNKPYMCAWFFEGPFISPKKKGAHDEKVLIPLNEQFLNKAIKDINIPIVVAIAPEEHDNLEAMKHYKDKVIFALGHSNANYQEACSCINAGAKRVIHLYNAMSGFSHRDMGIVNAILDKQYKSDTLIELISDGVHTSNEVIHTTFNILGSHNLGVVSDCLSPKGLEDGVYQLGTLAIDKKDNWCYLKGSTTLAGSCCGYNQLVKNFKLASGCNWNDLVRVSSYNNARNLKLPDCYGDLTLHQPANFIVVDEDINVLKHVINGNLVLDK